MLKRHVRVDFQVGNFCKYISGHHHIHFTKLFATQLKSDDIEVKRLKDQLTGDFVCLKLPPGLYTVKFATCLI